MAEELTALEALEKRAEEEASAELNTEPEALLADADPVAVAVKDTVEGSKVADAAELNAVAGSEVKGSLNADAGSEVKTSDAVNV